MEILNIDEVYFIKDRGIYFGKFISEEAAQYFIDNMSIDMAETVWLYVVSNGKTSITSDDINIFIEGNIDG